MPLVGQCEIRISPNTQAMNLKSYRKKTCY